jgi:hypothetical protein
MAYRLGLLVASAAFAGCMNYDQFVSGGDGGGADLAGVSVDLAAGMINLDLSRPDLLICTEADLPDNNFVDSNCDGIDGDSSDAVYVDPINGAFASSGGLGTREAPLRTLPEGLDTARRLNKHQILVAEGTMMGDGFINLLPNIGGAPYGIYGGYDKDWKRGPNIPNPLWKSFINKGVALLGADQQVTWDRVDIETAGTPNHTESSYAFLLVSCLAAPIVSNCSIKAGPGGDGKTLSPPLGVMVVGGPGGPGGNVACKCTFTMLQQCSSSCVLGGQSLCAQASPGGLPGMCPAAVLYPGGAGSPAGCCNGGAGKMGAGPAGGAPGSCDPNVGPNGKPGGYGAPGAPGKGGGAIGAITAQGYQIANGQGGSAGQPGSGGGGGGAKDGINGMCSNLCNEPLGFVAYGGGGGAGGCPGAGGYGGVGGGGSFAVWLWDSSPTLDNLHVTTGNGGRGGDGALGGDGGPGGAGGSGWGVNNLIGGNGGPGGPGGPGGQGGGAGGGPSVGIVQGGTSSKPSIINPIYAIGFGGDPGQAKNPGQPGLQAKVYP